MLVTRNGTAIAKNRALPEPNGVLSAEGATRMRKMTTAEDLERRGERRERDHREEEPTGDAQPAQEQRADHDVRGACSRRAVPEDAPVDEPDRHEDEVAGLTCAVACAPTASLAKIFAPVAELDLDEHPERGADDEGHEREHGRELGNAEPAPADA